MVDLAVVVQNVSHFDRTSKLSVAFVITRTITPTSSPRTLAPVSSRLNLREPGNMVGMPQIHPAKPERTVEAFLAPAAARAYI